MIGLEIFPVLSSLKYFLTLLAIVSGVFVIATKNAIISVFNLIVLYIIVAFYLIYIGIAYLGISYIVVYIGAIAILFLFIIMMIDIEVVEKRSNNYLPLLFLLIVGFLVTLKNILYTMGIMKIKSILHKEKGEFLIDSDKEILFDINDISNKSSSIQNYTINKENNIVFKVDGDLEKEVNISAIPSFEANTIKSLGYNEEKILKNNNLISEEISSIPADNNYLLVIPNWDSAVSRVTQVSAIGDVLYTVYHSYIYIVSVILLLGMVGAIILTAGNNHYNKILNIEKNKNSGFYLPLYLTFRGSNIKNKLGLKKDNSLSLKGIFPFFDVINNEKKHSEGIVNSLIYYIVSNLIIGLLFLFINSTFSLSVKYLEKGGGFECGFTSFVQTRERYNIIFYRVSLLFLVFDLEIILAFPYTALYQKNQNNGKNNVLAFLYILIVGFIYELKEGALNIVKTAHSTDYSVENLNIYNSSDANRIKLINSLNMNELRNNNSINNSKIIYGSLK
jgi:NADH-ubiquinone oxidoreductase chain 6